MAPAPSELSADDHLRIADEFLGFGARIVLEHTDAVTVGWAVTKWSDRARKAQTR